MTISLNPILMSNAAGTFSTTLDGFIQGFAMDDPAVRYQLTGGQLASTETIPMFGGVPIEELITNTSSVESSLQTSIARAASSATTTGFSVFNQNYAAINTPQSPVPEIAPGMLVNLYRMGSNARIAVALDPAAVSSLPTSPISPTAFYWDVTNYRLTFTTTGGNWALPTTIKLIGYNAGNSMIVVYNAGTTYATWTYNGNCALIQI